MKKIIFIKHERFLRLKAAAKAKVLEHFCQK
jgi:hypothetical protein